MGLQQLIELRIINIGLCHRFATSVVQAYAV